MEQNKEQAKILGITGGVGAGKSTVLEYLQEAYDACLIRCDDVAKELQEPGSSCFAHLAALLAPYGCIRDGRLDRKACAELLFSNKALLEKVNAIVHPAVRAEVEHRIAQQRGIAPLIVIEAALLIQSGYAEICDEIWCICADKEVRAKRLAASRGYSPERIRAMFASQPEDVFFREHSQLTIDNSCEDVQNIFEQIDRGLIEHGLLQHCQRKQR